MVTPNLASTNLLWSRNSPFDTAVAGQTSSEQHQRWFWALGSWAGYFYAGDPQTPQYDEDGNMLWDGAVHSGQQEEGLSLEYEYNAENQLVKVYNSSYVVEFKYDYMGRRVEQKATNRYTPYNVVYHRRFAYHGWHMIAEYDVLDGTPDCVRTYVWGPDDSHSYGGLGGIGGLLFWRDQATGKTYQPLYDGLGNVQAVYDLAEKHLVAEYEYDPYGNLVRETGYVKNGSTWNHIGYDPTENPFRYQTKWSLDASLAPVTETDIYAGYQQWDIYDYGLRWYLPRLGRFVNRDPIGEAGGTNLTSFTNNSPVALRDLLGLIPPHNAVDPGARDRKRRQARLLHRMGNNLGNGLPLYLATYYSSGQAARDYRNSCDRHPKGCGRDDEPRPGEPLSKYPLLEPNDDSDDYGEIVYLNPFPVETISETLTGSIFGGSRGSGGLNFYSGSIYSVGATAYFAAYEPIGPLDLSELDLSEIELEDAEGNDLITNPTGGGYLVESIAGYYAIAGGGGGSSWLLMDNGTIAIYTVAQGGFGVGGKGAGLQVGKVGGVYNADDFSGWFINASVNAGVGYSESNWPGGTAAITGGFAPGAGASASLQYYTLTGTYDTGMSANQLLDYVFTFGSPPPPPNSSSSLPPNY